MSHVIRFGYCPPSPGPKSEIRNKWYTDANDAIENWDGRSEIWVSYNKGSISPNIVCRLIKYG